MTSITAHHVRALVRSAADGLSVGLPQAALDHPTRSRGRRRLYLATGAAVTADVAVQELPALTRAVRGAPAEPPSADDLRTTLVSGAIACTWALAVTIADGPLAPLLRRRGTRRPHLLLGVTAGVATTACTLPGWWRQAEQRAATDAEVAGIDDELAALLDSG